MVAYRQDERPRAGHHRDRGLRRPAVTGDGRRGPGYAQTMLQRRRGMLLLGAGVSLLFFVLNIINGQLILAVIFGVLLVVNTRAYLRG
jgi:hypothetical protein